MSWRRHAANTILPEASADPPNRTPCRATNPGGACCDPMHILFSALTAVLAAVAWTPLALALALALDVATADATPGMAGEWSRGDGLARVHITPCGGQICATNTWVRDPGEGEAIGDQLVMTLAPEGDGRLVGTAFDVKRKMTYSMNIAVAPDHLTARGCIIKGIACKTMHWTRVR